MKYEVGGYVIDTTLYRISNGGAVVPVEPKVFDLLVYLLQHRDRVLSREELFQNVWDGRAVSDATLSNHVKIARKALGDNGDLQQTIQTIRGRGYQFVAPVREVADGVTGGDGGVAPSQDERFDKPAARVWRLPLALTVLLVSVALIGWRLMASAPAASSSGRPYILVVPFGVSDNATPEQALFADQLTREVIGNLRKISGLRVVPEASAFAFRNNKAREHIRGLLPDVRYVLDGVVSVSPDNSLRITPALEDLDADLSVWDKPFQARIDNTNFFEMASGIAAAVSAALKVEILKDEQRALAEFPTRNPGAYAPYVAGWRDMELLTRESVLRAIDSFNRAIELDPDFLAAYLARSNAYRSLFAYFDPPQDMLPKVKASLEDVLKRDPDSAEALSSLGLTQVMAWQWKEGWDNLNRAKALDPSLVLTELGLALYYSGLGENEKVKQSLARANELDPLNSELADWGNWALFMVGEQQASLAWGAEKMAQHPDNGFVFCGAGLSAYLRGDYAKGVELAEKGVTLSGRAPVALIMLAQAYGYAGQKDKVMPLLEEAESAQIYMCPYESAVVYLTLGDKDKAVELLHDAVAKRSNCLMFLRNDPRMKALRDDPRYAVRYAELLALVGLDDAALKSYKR
jgi:DNA-binding winged helix-turn-helix (wHTH) protein/TolB-like protein